MAQIHVTLRSKPLRNNKVSLYLDFYPPVYDPVKKVRTRREFLNLHSYEYPENALQEEFNQLTMIKAEKIRMERELQFLRDEFGILDKSHLKRDFLAYFESRIREHSASDGNRGNWRSALEHLKIYTLNKCKFSELDEQFCKGFQDYLKTASSINRKHKLSVNTQLSYYARLKVCLKEAVLDKIIKEDPSVRVKGIKQSDSSREHLTISELKAAYKIPFPENEILKKAAVFSALTGLRWSDIEKMVWAEIVDESGYTASTLRYRQKKTKGFEYLPISSESRELLGLRGDPDAKVFPGLKYSVQVTADLKLWLQRAGIYKHITFHCFRHTYATIQLTLGTDIYTVSKTLGHKNLKTTEIYAKVIDSKKRDAANRISLL